MRLTIARLLAGRGHRVVASFPTPRQNDAGMDAVRRHGLNACAHREIYVAMVKAA